MIVIPHKSSGITMPLRLRLTPKKLAQYVGKVISLTTNNHPIGGAVEAARHAIHASIHPKKFPQYL